MRALAHRLLTSGPSDVAGLAALFDRGVLLPEEVVAIVGKTEGNGGRNDFTRELAVRCHADLLATRLRVPTAEVEERVVFSMSGGTEGVVAPHVVVFGVRGEPSLTERTEKRLALGVGHTRAFEPEEIGRMPQVLETARVVREVLSGLGLQDAKDVHLVQMKGAIPAASHERAEAARRRGSPLRNDMVHSRGASALGAALATGEVLASELSDEAVNARFDLFSGVASVSSKPGLLRTEIVVLGNSPTWEGDLRAEHAVMRDLLDTAPVGAALARLGIDALPDDRLVAAFAKAEADPRGTIRGKRHVMLDDDDVDDTRWSRCALGAVLANVLGDTAIYVSTRAEHMGPPGGGPVALVARVG